jgi:hypothetical protein
VTEISRHTNTHKKNAENQEPGAAVIIQATSTFLKMIGKYNEMNLFLIK